MAFANPLTNLERLGLEHGMRVADIGAGLGAYALGSAKLVGDNGKVYAIDVQQDLLKKLKTESVRQKLHNIDVIWANAEKKISTKLHDAALDAAIISNVLFQSDDKRGFVEEAIRILKPGGKLMVIDWTDSFGGLGPHENEVFTKDKALALLHSFPVSLSSEFDAGDHHYGLIFIKR
jgi:ubiquinone/menaquinone biosynthesis C-methylase UbiE